MIHARLSFGGAVSGRGDSQHTIWTCCFYTNSLKNLQKLYANNSRTFSSEEKEWPRLSFGGLFGSQALVWLDDDVMRKGQGPVKYPHRCTNANASTNAFSNEPYEAKSSIVILPKPSHSLLCDVVEAMAETVHSL